MFSGFRRGWPDDTDLGPCEVSNGGGIAKCKMQIGDWNDVPAASFNLQFAIPNLQFAIEPPQV
jgi:hypothetical protein